MKLSSSRNKKKLSVRFQVYRWSEQEKCYYYVSKQSSTYSVLKLHFARIFSTFVYRCTASTARGKKTYVNIIKRISSPKKILKVASCPFFLSTKSPLHKKLKEGKFCLSINFANVSALRTLLLLSEGPLYA